MLYTGIDIVKRTHTALALQDDRRPLWSDFEFTNDRDGFESLLVQAVAPDDQVLVGADYMRIGNQ